MFKSPPPLPPTALALAFRGASVIFASFIRVFRDITLAYRDGPRLSCAPCVGGILKDLAPDLEPFDVVIVRPRTSGRPKTEQTVGMRKSAGAVPETTRDPGREPTRDADVLVEGAPARVQEVQATRPEPACSTGRDPKGCHVSVDRPVAGVSRDFSGKRKGTISLTVRRNHGVLNSHMLKLASVSSLENIHVQ